MRALVRFLMWVRGAKAPPVPWGPPKSCASTLRNAAIALKVARGPAVEFKMQPLDVLRIEQLRRVPYYGIFLCSECEDLAGAIVAFLAKSNSWDTPLEVTQVEGAAPDLCWRDDHGHGVCGGREEFFGLLTNGGLVNDRFVDRVTRRSDKSQFRDRTTRFLLEQS